MKIAKISTYNTALQPTIDFINQSLISFIVIMYINNSNHVIMYINNSNHFYHTKNSYMNSNFLITVLIGMPILCTPAVKPQNTSYVLTSPLYNPGLFSVFNTVIGALNYYDQGIISGLRVDFGSHGWYFDAARGNNWWNYYFEPIVLGENKQSDEPEQLFPTGQKIIFSLTAQFEMPRERAHELIQKYVHPRSHIIQHINTF